MTDFAHLADTLTHHEIAERLPLAYVCSQLGIDLNHDGRGLCPFHLDSRPSFRLWVGDDGRERWACSPCGITGDVFDLIRRIEDCDFGTAVEHAEDMLATLPEGVLPPVTKLRPRPDVSVYQRQIDVARARATQAEYGGALASLIGFPPGWSSCLVQIWGMGLTEGSSVYIPWWDMDGKLVGCRVRRGETKKSLTGSRFDHLYGAWRGRHHTRVLLTEGETDCVFAAAMCRGVDVYGIPGASATPTDEMLALLQGADVFLAFDGDDAGRRATARWLDAIPHARVCLLPEGLDIRTAQPDFTRLLADAVSTATV